MNEIITFTERIADNGQKGISAKELYKSLHPGRRDFTRWATRNIVNNLYLVKNTDWAEVLEATDSAVQPSADLRNPPILKNTRYSNLKDYILTPDAAMRIGLSAKTPRQATVVESITKITAQQQKKQQDFQRDFMQAVEKAVVEILSKQQGVGNYNQLLLENQQKDKAIESLSLQGRIKRNAVDCQNNIRQIVNIIAANSHWAQQPNAHQIIYNKIMQDYFRTHPVHWRSDWYALKDKEFRTAEFKRIFKTTGEKIQSKLDWIRLVHSKALIDIEHTARGYAVFILPQEYFMNGGVLPA